MVDAHEVRLKTHRPNQKSGHSAAGAVVAKAAESVHSRLKRLVYVDAVILPSGKSMFDVFPAQWTEGMRNSAGRKGEGWYRPPEQSMIFSFFGSDCSDEDKQWLWRKVTPQPVKPYEDKVDLGRFYQLKLPQTYVRCTKPQAGIPHPSASARSCCRWRAETGGKKRAPDSKLYLADAPCGLELRGSLTGLRHFAELDLDLGTEGHSRPHERPKLDVPRRHRFELGDERSAHGRDSPRHPPSGRRSTRRPGALSAVCHLSRIGVQSRGRSAPAIVANERTDMSSDGAASDDPASRSKT